MIEPIRLIELGETAWWKTQAYYHAVARRMSRDAPDTVILCRPDRRYTCVGYHQQASEILDLKAVNALQIPVLRRKLGGGTTYLDANQFFYQFIFHRSRLPVHFEQVFQTLLQPAVLTLRRLGLNATLRKVNEIEIDGRRIAGTGGGQIGEAGVVVGNFLLDFDFDTMVRIWNVPHEDFRELAARALRRQLTTLNRYRVPADDRFLAANLSRSIEEALQRPVQSGSFTEEEHRLAEKYFQTVPEIDPPSASRNGSRNRPMTSLKIAADDFIHYRQWETYRLSVWVKNGMIRECRLRNEAGERIMELENQLINTDFETWVQKLKNTCGILS